MIGEFFLQPCSVICGRLRRMSQVSVGVEWWRISSWNSSFVTACEHGGRPHPFTAQPRKFCLPNMRLCTVLGRWLHSRAIFCEDRSKNCFTVAFSCGEHSVIISMVVAFSAPRTVARRFFRCGGWWGVRNGSVDRDQTCDRALVLGFQCPIVSLLG